MPKRRDRIFLDACVMFSGCHSRSGGSSVILDACMAGFFKPVTSPLIIEEAMKGLRAKSDALAIHRLIEFMKNPGLEFVKNPGPADLEPYGDLIHSKDCHVLASAVSANCDFLITLDQKHFFSEKILRAKFRFRIVTPGQFITLTNES